MLNKLVAFRHQLHKIPDLSGQEAATANAVNVALRALAPDHILTELGQWQEPDNSQWGGTGIAAIFDGKKPTEGPSLLFRCELDGLPIEETAAHDHQSQIPGRSHACGHDGHMAILLGLAMCLSKRRPDKGRVILLFQPAEEIGKGARAIAADPAFQALSPDYAFALHNLPGLALGHVHIKEGATCCASRGLCITLSGKTSHASMPQDGLSPLRAITEIVAGLEQLSNGLDNGQGLDEAYKLVTITHLKMGEACFGVAPGEAEIWVTLRTVSDAAMSELLDASSRLVKQTADHHGLTLTIKEDDIFDACTNAAQTTEMVRLALKHENVPYEQQPDPMRFSEDFGQFGQTRPATLFLLGSGVDQPQLHNPDYDFPDSLISTGVQIFHRLVQQELCS